MASTTTLNMGQKFHYPTLIDSSRMYICTGVKVDIANKSLVTDYRCSFWFLLHILFLRPSFRGNLERKGKHKSSTQFRILLRDLTTEWACRSCWWGSGVICGSLVCVVNSCWRAGQGGQRGVIEGVRVCRSRCQVLHGDGPRWGVCCSWHCWSSGWRGWGRSR